MSLYAIDRDTGVALYAKIAELMEREYVRQGAAGDRLPGVGELAVRFGVNRHILHRAVDQLIAEGLLERQHGVCLFITDRLLDYRVGSGTRVTQTLADIDISNDTKVARKMIAPASAGVARNRKLSSNEPVTPYDTMRVGYEDCSLHGLLTKTVALCAHGKPPRCVASAGRTAKLPLPPKIARHCGSRVGTYWIGTVRRSSTPLPGSALTDSNCAFHHVRPTNQP